MKLNRLIAFLLLAVIALSFCSAFADNSRVRTVIGADLSPEQVNMVYESFGIRRGSCIELRVSNAEERSYLRGIISDAEIGTRSISCVYFELLPAGSGLQVSTVNITAFSPESYISAMITAGITDARVIVAAPFAVSGTAALTGVYKAYEDITGIRLETEAKQAGTRELTITGELTEEIGGTGTTAIVNEIKTSLDETAGMNDAELRKLISDIAYRANVKLSDKQIDRLVDLCRSFQKLDMDSLKDRTSGLQDTLHKLGEAKDKVTGFAGKVRAFFESVARVWNNIKSIFG